MMAVRDEDETFMAIMRRNFDLPQGITSMEIEVRENDVVRYRIEGVLHKLPEAQRRDSKKD